MNEEKKNNVYKNGFIYSKLVIALTSFMVIMYLYNYVFTSNYSNVEDIKYSYASNCIKETSLMLPQPEKQYIKNISFWKKTISALEEKVKLNKIYNKQNILCKNIKSIITLNSIGGKLDCLIIKQYNKDVFFQFSNKNNGGILTMQAVSNFFILNFYDMHLLYEKLPGTFIFMRNIVQNIQFCKIYNFSQQSKIINVTFKFINKSLNHDSIKVNILLSISNYLEKKTKHVENAWRNTSNILIKCGNHINYMDLKSTTISFKKYLVNNISYIAINNRYFIIALFLECKNTANAYNIIDLNRFFINRILTPIQLTNLIISLDPVSLNIYNIQKFKINLYLGQKKFSCLKNFGLDMEKNIDFGIFSIVSKSMLFLLLNIHCLFNNFGVSIVILTLCIKIITFPLTKKSIISLEKTKDIAPKLKIIQKKYSHDKALMNQKQIELYKKYNINPLSGCFPILIQTPIWIALYQTLLNSVELYQQPFVLWITDLTLPDHYFILPIIMGVSMFIQFFFQPTTSEQQRYILWILPILLTGIMIKYQLPSGLSLYIFTNNILSILQQIYIKSSKKINI